MTTDALASGAAVGVGEWLASPDDVGALRDRVQAIVAAHHDDEPLSPGLELHALAATLGAHAGSGACGAGRGRDADRGPGRRARSVAHDARVRHRARTRAARVARRDSRSRHRRRPTPR